MNAISAASPLLGPFFIILVYPPFLSAYFGQLVYKPSIGDEKKDLEASDIVKANRLLYVSSLVGLVFFCISYLLVRALAL